MNPPDTPNDPWQRVLADLRASRPPYPLETVRWAMGERETLAPRFVEVLAQVARDGGAVEDGYTLHLWAMAYLAAWRDTRAWEPMLALFRLPYETLDELLGDLLFEMGGRALASVCPGDVAPLRDIALDESFSNWVRMTVLDAWRLRVMLSGADVAPFEDALLALGERNAAALRRGEHRPAGEPEIIDDVASQVCDIGSERLRAAVHGWFDERLIDEQSIDRGFFDREMARTPEQRLLELQQRPRQGYVVDPVQETRWWYWWHEDEHGRPFRQPSGPGATVRAGPKVGRNDPCPCGSGRKYKKCHGAN